MLEIETIDEICTLAKVGFTDWKRYGDVATKTNGDLMIFNYTAAAQFAGRWNFFERVSRGLIIDRATGAVAARPFDKFFNWGEGGRTSTAKIKSVTEKWDGSLGILYWQDDLPKIATRGSFTSDQALWATEWIAPYADILRSCTKNVCTLLFEIVYPENRVVVDYEGWSGLVLLAGRYLETGKYVGEHVGGYMDTINSYCQFIRPSTWLFSDVNHIKEFLPTLTSNREGFVVEFEDGERFKFKGDAYLALHKLISGLSFKHTLEAVARGEEDTVKAQVPDEFIGQFNGWLDEIYTTRERIEYEVEVAYMMAPKDSRKDYALWVSANQPDLSRYLFARLDGHDIRPIIYRKAFENRTDETAVKQTEATA